MNETLQVFRIPKTTATHADVLAAVGLADLLQCLFDESVELQDTGADFLIALPGPLPDDFRKIPHSPRYPWLNTASGGEQAPQGLTAINMSEEFQRVKRWFENQRKIRKQKVSDPELLRALQHDAPIARWWILAPLTATRLKSVSTWNRVAETIAQTSPGEFRVQVRTCLKAIAAGYPSESGWPATSNGLFCPPQIKGFNELKPQGTSRGSMPIDAFQEWLRYQGYWRCANVVSDSDNIRVYVPIPMRLTPGAIERLSLELERQPLFGCGAKSDALVTIAIGRLLIEHSAEYHAQGVEPFPGLRLYSGGTPASLVSGLYVTHYAKTSRQAYGVKSIGTLALPGWFPIRNRQDAEDWLAILDEHQRVIRGFQDDHSDEIGLLVAYRRFLERRGDMAIWALLEFMEQYGVFVMRANGSRQDGRIRWTPRFTGEYLRRIVMGTNDKLLEIINDPGFDAVARAVRQATVTSQNKKARGEDVWREIRYELLHDLHRTRKVPGNAFVERVMDFVSRYNYENARRRETAKNPKAAPANISDEELKSFIALINRHGTSLVGALLAAYGSCKEKWEPEDAGTGQPASSPAVDSQPR
jgi:hypothetical protein